MEMETSNTTVEDLFYKVKDYVNTRFDLLKLKAINKVSSAISKSITTIVLLVFSVLILLFFSIGLALYLGYILGHNYYGFFIVGGIYIIIGLILISSRKALLKTPLSNWLIRTLMD